MSKHSPIIERRMSIGGRDTRVLEVAGDGPPILLLHGFTDSADTWRWVLEDMAVRGRRAVAVDMPGHGQAPPLGRPAIDDLDAFAAAFVRAFADNQRPVLAGNSLGGAVALRAAADGTLPLLAVSGICPAGLAHQAPLEKLDKVARAMRVFHPVIARMPVPRRLLQRSAASFYHRRLMYGVKDREPAERYASHIRGMGDLVRFQKDVVALGASMRIKPRAGVLDHAYGVPVEQIQVPVLLIWGKHDHLVDVKGASFILDSVAPSRLVTLDDCGHCPQLQRPDRIAEVLTALPAMPEIAPIQG
ncbi:MAG TPA: alpha/beta hydrolase [Nocardioidaceae bacterium]|nr:alpha/beta hydrolase [Nocardioidaceae bacterium]